MILDELALPYYDLKSFDDLPIPFACVATDLVDQKEHVFRGGSLALALRSTMSLPGIFTPVHHDGHIYVDGGLLNNFPTNVVRGMGADLVIGVHLQTSSLKADASLSSFSVLDQSISVVIADNERRAMRDADIVITVPLLKYTSMDFNQAKDIGEAGYQAAAANADRLMELSVDEASWKRYLAEREARRKNAVVPLYVKVTGVSPDIAEPLAKEMSLETGHTVETAELDHEMMDVTGLGPFSGANYTMTEQDGRELRLGYEGGYQRLSPQIVDEPELPTVSGVTGDFRLQYTLDRLDQPVIPRSGNYLKFYTKYYNENPAAPHGFPLSEAQIENFFRISEPSSIFLNAFGGSSYGFKTGIPAFGLGGVTRFLAFGTNELLTNQYFLFQTGYVRTLK